MRSIPLFALVFLFAALSPLAGEEPTDVQPALDGDFAVPEPRTREEITAAWQALEATPMGTAYAEKPRSSAPFATGKLTPAYMARGLAALNFFRFVAGLPADLEIYEPWNEEAQHGAVLLDYLHIMEHYPPYPENSGMTRAFYDRAYAGTSTSNLMGGGTSPLAVEGENGLDTAVFALMYDSDARNVKGTGHRRSFLNPEAQKAGFGFATTCAAIKLRPTEESLNAPDRRLAYVAWPPSGNIPLSAFRSSELWTVYMYSGEFPGGKLQGKDKVAVTLKRERDGKTWRFTPEAAMGDFSVVATDWEFDVIFRPADLSAYQPEDTFSVTIDGVTDGEGNEVPIAYSATFWSIEPPIVPKVESRHPAATTIAGSFTTTTKELRGKSFNVTGKSVSFGFTGHPLKSFTLVVDTPDGVLPIGVELNGSGKVFAPGEEAKTDDGEIRSVRFTSTVSTRQFSYYIYSDAKGHSKQYDVGETASFDGKSPIESITIFIE